MQVLLLRPVKGLGEAGKIIETKAGYAMNYLVPKKLATTDLKAKVVKTLSKISPEKLSEILRKISKHHLTLNKKTNEKGILFSSVTAEEIKDQLEKLFPDLLATKVEIRIPEHIKSLGEYMAKIRVLGREAVQKIHVIDSLKPKPNQG